MSDAHGGVTVLGLGLMGQALARAFLKGGHITTVWNRSAGKAEQLAAEGAVHAELAREAVTASPLVVICLTDYDAVRDLIDPLGDALAGRVVVNLTSGTSAQARQFAEWVELQDAGYLDGAILAIPPAIGTEEAVVLYSGPRSAFDRHELTLSHVGTIAYLGDDHGLASLHDVAVLSMMWNNLNGFLHGAALLGAAGVSATSFAPLATQMIKTVADWMPDVARLVDDGNYPVADSTIDTHLAAIDHLVDESEALGVNSELPVLIKTFAERAVADGHGGDEYAALIEQFRQPVRRP